MEEETVENPVSIALDVAHKKIADLEAELERFRASYEALVDSKAEETAKLLMDQALGPIDVAFKEIEDIISSCHRSEMRESEAIQKIHAVLHR